MGMPATEPFSSTITAEQLERLSLPGNQAELVRGRLVVREPPGTRHGRIAANLAYFLSDFVRKHGLGVVFAQDTGFKIESNPDTVRAPDVAFLAQARADMIPDSGYASLAPDLLAEIVSRGDAPGEVLAKIAGWLDAGTRLVWVIDPDRGEARVYRPDGSLSVVGAEGLLEGES